MRSRGFLFPRTLLLAGAMALLVLLSTAQPALARNDRYAYRDVESNPLSIAYYALYPVGKLLEWVVFRPIHAVGSLVVPPPGRLGRGTSYSCGGLRPRRGCISGGIRR